MVPIQKILQPVDFTERSLRMTVYARALALKYDAELTLLHVVNPMYSFPATAISGPVMVPVPTSVITEHQQRLEQFAVEELQGVRVRRLIYEGDVAEQISEFAQSEGVGLAIMSTHGYGVLRRFLIGSTAAKVLHDVTCPVLTGAHLADRVEGTPAFSNVLCAVDLDSHGESALAWASQFAADFQARLGLVHIVESADDATRAREQLGVLQSTAGAPLTIYVEAGETAEAVCDVAKHTGADLLIIGRGVNEDATGALATTAYSIIRQSPCAVVSLVGPRTIEK